jgi:hypothetical protein
MKLHLSHNDGGKWGRGKDRRVIKPGIMEAWEKQANKYLRTTRTKLNEK